MRSTTLIMFRQLTDCLSPVFLVGPQRSLTSWFDSVLRGTGLFNMPHSVKETFYFDKKYFKGSGWYDSQFSHVPNRPRLEVSPTYFGSTLAIKRISEDHPDSRIIISIRDPIERSLSSFQHHYSKGRVNSDIVSSLDLQPSIITDSQFSLLIPRWLKSFPSQNVFFLDVRDTSEKMLISQFRKLTVFLSVNVDSNVIREQISKPVGYSLRPRFPMISQAAANISFKLRNYDLHCFPNLAKQIGLKHLLFGKRNNASSVSEYDLQLLRSILEEKLVAESPYLSSLLNSNV